MIEHKRLSLVCAALCSAVSFAHAQTSGSINVKYVVLSVMYAPPGSSYGTNYVKYDTSTMVGVSTDISASFKSGSSYSVDTNLATSAAVTPVGPASTGPKQFTNQRDTGTAISLNKLAGVPWEVDGQATAGIDNSADVIVLWLNPVLNFEFLGNSTNAIWTGYSYDTADIDGMDLVTLTVAQLRNPSAIDGGTLAKLARSWDGSGLGGLTAADYATILARDPNVVDGTNIDPARFDLLLGWDVLYEGGGNGTTASYGDTTLRGQSASDTFSVGYALRPGNPASFNNLLSAALNSPNELTWTNQYSQTRNQNSGQSAAAFLWSAQMTDVYSGGPPFLTSSVGMNMAKDNIYGTYLYPEIAHPK